MTQAARRRRGQHRQPRRRQWRRASTTPKRSTTQVRISASYAHLRLQHLPENFRVCTFLSHLVVRVSIPLVKFCPFLLLIGWLQCQTAKVKSQAW